MAENVAHGGYRISSLYMSHGSSFVQPTTINPTHLSTEAGIPVVQNCNCTSIELNFASENVPPSKYDQLLAAENYAVSNSFSAYPLFYGNCHQFGDLQPGFGVLPKSVSNPLEPAERAVVENLFCDKDASKKNAQTNVTDGLENLCTIGCDLSLRLGPFFLPPCSDVGNSQSQDVKDDCFQEGIKLSNQSSELDEEFHSFPRANTYVPLGSCSNRWNLEGGYMTVEEKMRKQKAGLDHPMEDQQFFWQPKLRFSHLTGSMRNAGS